MSMSISDLSSSGGALVVRQPCRLADGRPMPLAVPDDEVDEFMRSVELEERARLREVWQCFREMLAARSLKAGAEAAAGRRAHLGWGWSARALLKLFTAYRDGGYKPGDCRKLGASYPAGDWRILLRGYDGKQAVLPTEFTRWLNEQFATFRGRTDCVRALWRHVVYELWLKGAPIPGYGTIDEWCRRAGRARPNPLLVRPGELPEGWSEATFRRQLPKARAVLLQLAHGYLAAHSAQPDQVLTDRSPLMPLQYVFLDDSRPDVRCLHFRRGRGGEMVYPLLVLGLDAATGVDLANCAKPRALKAPEAESAIERRERHGVTQDMALLIVCETLRKWGLPPWPITFVHENAAACIPPEAKRALESVYGDRIRFEATGIFKEKMLAYGFTDQGGAPYDKAPIEAFWRILMTQIARLPGSTGPRYDTAPGDLKQIERHTLGLLERAGGVESVFKLFRSPLLDFTQAHEAIERALKLLRFRTAHKLQGFERVQEWRRSPADQYRPWEEFLALPPAEQDAVAAAGNDNIVSYTECPAQRFVRLLQGVKLAPVDDDLLLWIEGPRQPARVRNGKITVRDTARFGDDELIFRETDHELLGAEHEGRTYEAVIARDGSRIVLTEEGRILGSVAQQGRISRADTEAIHREQGRVRAARVADRELLRGYYLADTDAALAELRAHNEAVTKSPELSAAGTQPKLAKKSSATGKRRAALNAELAAATRATAEPVAPGGSLYGEETHS